MKRRVVITGMGALTPIGNDVPDTWESAKNGVCGIEKITLFDASENKASLAGEVKNFRPELYMDKKEVRNTDRFTQLGLAASVEAMADSGLDMTKINAERCGVIIASGIGGITTIEQEHSRGLEKGFDRISPFFIPQSISNMTAARVAIRHGFHGMCTCVVTACAAGTNAIGDAFRQIRDGYADLMMAGGAEASISHLAVGGFTSMKALSTATDPARASIPFDAERNGFVMGEGAAVLVLEEYEHAVARNAKIYAEVVGYASNCDAYHITSPSPSGEYGAKCLLEAVNDAGIAATDIDYINAHGTSTPINDPSETSAVKAAFGEHAYKLMMSSTKSMTGHLLGAAGAVEAVLSVCALRDGIIPPTINYSVPDPACDLDIVPNKARTADIRYALSNSLGFGGHNACLVFKKYEA